jgi:hypothetical protein
MEFITLNLLNTLEIVLKFKIMNLAVVVQERNLKNVANEES